MQLLYLAGMDKIRAILVDDEESARDVLQSLLLRFCPEVELLYKCSDLLQAVEIIKKEQPDLVFLDIEMPNYAGFEIVNFFDEFNFSIIFVTAYDKYALRAFDVAAIDYLLKPIEINRLKQAVCKARNHLDLVHNKAQLQLLNTTIQAREIKNIMVMEKGYQQIIPTDKIIAIEAQESYCFIHTADKKYTASRNLKHFETMFSEYTTFIRVHKSWIVAKNHILNYSKSDLSICLSNGLIAKLSKYKKAEFEESISG